MVAQFVDGRVVHDDFQEWRMCHPSGFILRFTATRRAYLHRVGCSHFGKPTWKYKPGGHSLTSHLKVCSNSRRRLEKWAAEGGVTVTECGDCLGKRPKPSRAA